MGAPSPEGCGCHWHRDVGWACPSLLSSLGEGGRTEGLQAPVSGAKAKCIAPCQPQEERRKHHLSAGAGSVGDCSGLPQTFIMKMA